MKFLIFAPAAILTIALQSTVAKTASSDLNPSATRDSNKTAHREIAFAGVADESIPAEQPIPKSTDSPSDPTNSSNSAPAKEAIPTAVQAPAPLGKKPTWKHGISAKEIFTSEGREGRHFFAALQPIGFMPEGGLDFIPGASIGFYPFSDLLITLDGGAGFSLFGASDYGYNDAISEYGLHAKYFVYKFAFVKAGYSHRSFSTSHHEYSDSPYKHYSFEEEAFDLAVGAQFQLKFFTFGCDALTIYKPIWKHEKSDAGLTGDDLANTEILKIYAGVSF